MAVVNTKAQAITAADSQFRTQAPITVGPRRVYGDVGLVAVANGDSIASTLRFFRVPSSAGVRQILKRSTAITSAAMDIGLYQTAANGGAVVDVDFFASAVSIATADLVGTDVTFEAGAGPSYLVTDVEKPIWQVLGLAADPKVDYDVVGTLTAAATAAGSVALHIDYTAAN